MRALLKGREAASDRRASCLFCTIGARPPEADRADFTGGKSRDRYGNPMTVKVKGVVEPFYVEE